MIFLVAIALVTLEAQCLLPVGLGLLAVGLRKKHAGMLAASLAALGLFLAARPLWIGLSPIEWIVPALATRLTTTIPGYRIEYYQEPTTIFFRDMVEVHDAYGGSATALVHPDTNKCWFPTAVQTATTLDIVCQPSRVALTIKLADWPPPGSEPRSCLETLYVDFSPPPKLRPAIHPLYC